MQQGGRAKEDGKPCVTIILFETNLLQTSPSFKQIFFCEILENINVK